MNDNQMTIKNENLSFQILTQDEIMTYGHEVTNDISSFSVRILDKLGHVSNEDASKVLIQLNDIMKSFKIEDFEDEKKSLFGKLFKSASKKIEAMMSKYTNFNTDIDKIYKEIKTYELDIKDSNKMLDEMFEENRNYHCSLEELITSANDFVEGMRKKLGEDQSQIDQVDIADKIEMMEQRIYDLELAKAVSVQTAPQIKLLQKTNYNLVRKINSSFVITLPIFRQSLIQAITIKRQAIQTEALQGLDDATNELLMKNATNMVENTKQAALLNGQPMVKIDTLKKSYDTIINGIIEVEKIEEENKSTRKQGLAALRDLKEHITTGTPIVLPQEEIQEEASEEMS